MDKGAAIEDDLLYDWAREKLDLPVPDSRP